MPEPHIGGWAMLAAFISRDMIDGPFTVIYYAIKTPRGSKTEHIVSEGFLGPMEGLRHARERNCLPENVRVSRYQIHHRDDCGYTFTEIDRYQSVSGRTVGMREVPVPGEQVQITPETYF